MSSDGWDSPGPFDASGTQGGWDPTEAGSGTIDDDWPGFEDGEFQTPRATSLTPLWISMGFAAAGAATGFYVLVTTGFAREVVPGAAVTMVVIGWLLSGLVAVGALAVYQRQDLRKASSAFYAPNPAAASLRIAVLVTGAIGVVINSYVFATWLARH